MEAVRNKSLMSCSTVCKFTSVFVRRWNRARLKNEVCLCFHEGNIRCGDTFCSFPILTEKKMAQPTEKWTETIGTLHDANCERTASRCCFLCCEQGSLLRSWSHLHSQNCQDWLCTNETCQDSLYTNQSWIRLRQAKMAAKDARSISCYYDFWQRCCAIWLHCLWTRSLFLFAELENQRILQSRRSWTEPFRWWSNLHRFCECYSVEAFLHGSFLVLAYQTDTPACVQLESHTFQPGNLWICICKGILCFRFRERMVQFRRCTKAELKKCKPALWIWRRKRIADLCLLASQAKVTRIKPEWHLHLCWFCLVNCIDFETMFVYTELNVDSQCNSVMWGERPTTFVLAARSSFWVHYKRHQARSGRKTADVVFVCIWKHVHTPHHAGSSKVMDISCDSRCKRTFAFSVLLNTKTFSHFASLDGSLTQWTDFRIWPLPSWFNSWFRLVRNSQHDLDTLLRRQLLCISRIVVILCVDIANSLALDERSFTGGIAAINTGTVVTSVEGGLEFYFLLTFFCNRFERCELNLFLHSNLCFSRPWQASCKQSLDLPACAQAMSNDSISVIRGLTRPLAAFELQTDTESRLMFVHNSRNLKLKVFQEFFTFDQCEYVHKPQKRRHFQFTSVCTELKSSSYDLPTSGNRKCFPVLLQPQVLESLKTSAQDTRLELAAARKDILEIKAQVAVLAQLIAHFVTKRLTHEEDGSDADNLDDNSSEMEMRRWPSQ